MKRLIFIHIVFLILGMLVTTLVAWALSANQKLNVGFMTTGSFVRTQEPLWSVRTYSQQGALRVNSKVVTVRRPYGVPPQAPHWSKASIAPTREEHETDLSVEERAYGWPMLSHFHRKFWRNDRGVIFEWSVAIPGYARSWWTNNRELPLGTIWPGFAINTVFYAAILWLPFAPFQLRRMIRRKRGCCIKCGYDLRNVEHEVCPECGAGVS